MMVYYKIKETSGVVAKAFNPKGVSETVTYRPKNKLVSVEMNREESRSMKNTIKYIKKFDGEITREQFLSIKKKATDYLEERGGTKYE